ncbi:tRNA dihydrouridine synthase DusB [Hirschia litorea]|uniref:tRNA-dihydrouridine synthase n=1 Tax=Hirschia litorea TaxID=1199156 RepID=A0ABW2IHW0_9PROT
MISLGDVHIEVPVFLAPMSGATDAPFRRQASKYGAPVVVTEMIAGSELATGRQDMMWRISKPEDTYPFVVQLAGRDPDWMFEAAKISADSGADVIDINMGCPSRQVTGGQSGSALMRDLDLARKLIVATREGGQKPVSVKMRLGWDDDSLNSPELAQICEEEGVQLLTVHGRTRCQFYEGIANWSKVRFVKEACNLPVIVNGDIIDARSAQLAKLESGADGVMIGRAAMGRPWLLGEIAAQIANKPYTAPSWQEKLDSLSQQLSDSIELYGERLGVRVFRKHLAAFIDMTPELKMSSMDRKDLRGRLCRISDGVELKRDISFLQATPISKELLKSAQ